MNRHRRMVIVPKPLQAEFNAALSLAGYGDSNLSVDMGGGGPTASHAAGEGHMDSVMLALVEDLVAATPGASIHTETMAQVEAAGPLKRKNEDTGQFTGRS